MDPLDILFKRCHFGSIYVHHPEGTDQWTITTGGVSGKGTDPRSAIIDLEMKFQEREKEGLNDGTSNP